MPKNISKKGDQSDYNELMGNLKRDAERIRDFLKDLKKVALIPHWDSDGLTSAVLFTNAIRSILLPITRIILPKTGHYGITDDMEKRLRADDFDLLLITDKELQTHDINRVKDVVPKILIVDHHDFPISTGEIPKNMIVVNPKIYGIDLNVPSGFLMYNLIKHMCEMPWLKRAIHLAAISIYCDYAEDDLDFFLNDEVFTVYPYLCGKWRQPAEGEEEISTWIPSKLSFIITDAFTHSLDKGAYIAIKALENSIEQEDPLNILYGRDEESKMLRNMSEELRFEPLKTRPLQEYYNKTAWGHRLIFKNFIYSEVNAPYFLSLSVAREFSTRYHVPAFIVNNFDYTQSNVLLNGYVSKEVKKKPDLREISKEIAEKTNGEWFGSRYTSSISVPVWNAKKIIDALYKVLEN